MDSGVRFSHLLVSIAILILTFAVVALPVFRSYWVVSEKATLDQVLDNFIQPEYFSLKRLSLNGDWRCKVEGYDAGVSSSYYSSDFDDSGWEVVKVPFLRYSTDSNSSLWLRKTFVLEENTEGRRVKLVFKGAWLIAEVWMNDRYLGKHTGYFSSFYFDVTDYLIPHERNVIAVFLSSPVDTNLRDKFYVEGIYNDWDVKPYPNWALGNLPPNYEWHVPIGLWKGVELAVTGDVSIDLALLDARVTGSSSASLTLKLLVNNRNENELSVEIGYTISGYNFDVETISGTYTTSVSGSSKSWVSFNIPLSNVKYWWTWDQGDPNLYKLDLNMSVGGATQGSQSLRFGVRSITGQINRFRSELLLNGRFVFMRGGNYISDFNLTNSDAGRLEEDLRLFRGANLNFIRVHAHIEPYEFYELCDELGMAVMSDFPMIFSYLGPNPGQQARELFLDQAQRQAVEMALMLYNNPSVIIYGIHNEPPWALSWWGDYYQARVNYEEDSLLQRLVSSIDGSRLMVTASGAEDEHLYFGWYGGDWTQFKTASTGFPTEFGAQSLPSMGSPFWSLVNVSRWPISEGDPEFYEFQYRDYQPSQWSSYGIGEPSHYSSLEDYIVESQRYQAMLLKTAVDRFRILKRNVTAGVTFFMLTDCFPSITWSILDYYRVPKLAYLNLTRAMSPTRVIVDWGGNYKVDGKYRVVYEGGSTITFDVWVVNDRWSATGPCSVSWKVYDLTLGGVLLNDSKQVDLPGAESPASKVTSIAWEPPPFEDTDHVLRFEAELRLNGTVENIDTFDFTVRASAVLEISAPTVSKGERLKFAVLLDGNELKLKDLDDGRLVLSIPGGKYVKVFGPGLAGNNTYLPMGYDLGVLAPGEKRRLEVQLVPGAIVNLLPSVPAVESDELLSTKFTILKGYPAQGEVKFSKPLKVYMLKLQGVEGGWTDPDEIAAGFESAMRSWLSGIPIDYKLIETSEDYASILRSEEKDVILINAHGEIIPYPEIQGLRPDEFFPLIMRKFSEDGWTIINTAGYPFYYLQFRGRTTEIGPQGLAGLSSALGLQLEVEAPENPIECSVNPDLLSVLWVAGSDIPMEITSARLLKFSGVDAIPLYISPEGSLAAGLLNLKNGGGFGFIGLGPDVDSRTKGLIAAAMIFVKYRGLSVELGQPLVAPNFIYQYNSSNWEALAYLGIVGGKVVVPADAEVSIRADVWSSKISTSVVVGNGSKPIVLRRNSAFTSEELTKAILKRNLLVVQRAVEQARFEVEQASRRGFYLGLELDRLKRASELFSSLNASVNTLDSAYNLRQAYTLASDIRSDVSQVLESSSVSAPVAFLVVLVLAVGLASIISESRDKMISLTIILLVVFMLLVQQTYPGISEVTMSEMTIGLYLLAIAFAAIFLLPLLLSEIKTEGGVSLTAAIPMAFSMAAGNLRRRKLRTVLALLSITTMVLALSSLTSVSTTFTSTELMTSLVAPQGRNLILVRNEPSGFSTNDLEWMASQPEALKVAVKAQNPPVMMLGYVDGYPIYGVIGLQGEVPQIDQIKSALMTPLPLEELFTRDFCILISEDLASHTHKVVGQKISFRDLELTVVGVFDPARLSGITEIDNSPWFPQRTSPGVQGLVAVSPENLIITNLKTSALLGAYPQLIYFFTRSPEDAIRVGRRVSLLTGYQCSVWPSGMNVRYYYPARSLTLSGSSVIMPMGIIVLNLALVMISNVYERRKEITILSMVGLNPTHVFLLFLSEAFILGFIGGSLGYLSSFTAFRAIQILGYIFPVDVKASYVDMFVIVSVSVLTAIFSAIVPSLKASTLVTPSLSRRWKIEAERMDRDVWSLLIPAKIAEEKLSLMASQFCERLKDYSGLAIELIVDDITLEDVLDEEGRRLPKIRFTYGRGGNRPFTSHNLIDFKRSELGKYDVLLTTKITSINPKFADNYIRDVGSFVRKLVIDWASSKARVVVALGNSYDYILEFIKVYHPQQIIALTRRDAAAKLRDLRSRIRAEGLWPPALDIKEVASQTAPELLREILPEVKRADMVCIDSDDGLLSSVLLAAATLAKRRVGTVVSAGKFSEFQAEVLLEGPEYAA